MGLRTPLAHGTLAAAAVVVVLCVALRVAAAAPATSPAGPRQPVCAILIDPGGDVEQRAPALLLEAELTQGGGLRTVERDAIQQIVKEQELQQLFGSDAGPRRQALGQLLKADLLVLLRGANGAENRPVVQLVVSETSRGLRLCNVSLDPAAASGGGDAARRLLDATITKWREGVDEVYAVSPFMNDDLSFEFDPVKQAYALIIEQRLLARPRTLVVELAEARAIALELALHGAAAVQPRPLPVLVSGAFRHHDTGAARRVAITLTMTRGQAEIGKRSSAPLAPANAPAFIGGAVDELLKGPGGAAAAAAAPPDPRADAAQLAARADAFRKWGNRDDALALYDASVLLDPAAAPPRHADAMMMAATLGDALRYADPMRAIPYRRRAIDHFETFASRTTITAEHKDLLSEFLRRLGSSSGLHPHVPPEVHRASDVELRHVRDVLLRVFESKALAGVHDRTLEYCMYWIPWRVGADETVRDAFGILERVALSVKDHPKGATIVQRLFGSVTTTRRGARWEGSAQGGKSSHADHRAEEARLLDRLASAPDAPPALREAALNVKALRAQAPTTRPGTAAKSPTPTPPAPDVQQTPPAGLVDVSFRKLLLDVVRPDGSTARLGSSPTDWLPGPGNTDLVKTNRGVFVMRVPGRLEPLFNVQEGWIRSVAHDGRHVWIATGAPGGSTLNVIDPTTRQRWTTDQPLPPKSTLNLTPLPSGEVFGVGAFARTWCSVYRLDPARGIVERRLLEARQTLDDRNLHRVAPADAVFRPVRTYVLQEAGRTQLVVERDVWVHDSSYATSPLQIDLAAGTVEPKRNGLRDSVAQGDTLYCVASADGRTKLLSAQLPTLATRTLLDPAPPGQVVFDGARVHIVGHAWSIAERPEGPYRTLRGTMPPVSPSEHPYRRYRVHHSLHHGLVLFVWASDAAPAEPYAVVFHDRPGR